MERDYADVLIGSGELSRPGYRSPAQSGIIAKITKLVESRISQLKKGTATGQHDAEVDDNLDLFCRAIIEHRQEHVEKGKVAQRKKEVDKQEGEQHREQAFQTFKGNQHVVDVDGDERGSTSKYHAPAERQKRKSPTKVDRTPPSIGGSTFDEGSIAGLLAAKAEHKKARALSEPIRAEAKRMAAEAQIKAAEAQMVMMQSLQSLLNQRMVDAGR
jgi:hypothetical protein